jgi:hypothetical protein
VFNGVSLKVASILPSVESAGIEERKKEKIKKKTKYTNSTFLFLGLLYLSVSLSESKSKNGRRRKRKFEINQSRGFESVQWKGDLCVKT